MRNNENVDDESCPNERIVIPPIGYRLLMPNEIIRNGDIEEASWSRTGWNMGVGENEIGRKAEENHLKIARSLNIRT